MPSEKKLLSSKPEIEKKKFLHSTSACRARIIWNVELESRFVKELKCTKCSLLIKIFFNDNIIMLKRPPKVSSLCYDFFHEWKTNASRIFFQFFLRKTISIFGGIYWLWKKWQSVCG